MWVLYDHDYAENEGVERLLDLFDRHQLKITFVVNGIRVEESPELALEVQRRGHEMAGENYIHEYVPMYTPDEEREELQKTIDAFEKVLGQRPYGYVSPGHRPTPATVPTLMDMGYKWDADFQDADDPFIIHGDDGRRMVGTPYSYLSDYQTYLQYGRTPRQWLEMLYDEFNGLRREGQAGKPRMLGFAMHPFLCHPFRTAILDEFLGEVTKHPDVWVTSREAIADWVLENPDRFRSKTLQEVLDRFPEK